MTHSLSIRYRFFLFVLLACFASLMPTFAAGPPAPTLKSPANNATGTGVTQVMIWYSVSGAIKYTLQVSRHQNFDTLVVNRSGIKATQSTLYGLFNGLKYYWRVCAYNALGQVSAWSTWNFTTRMATVTNGNHIGPTDVGIWYEPDGGISWNSSPTDNGAIGFKPLGPSGPTDFRDPYVIDSNIMSFELSQIANAKIDFLIFDNTNGGFCLGYGYNSTTQTVGYVQTSGVMCQIIKNWNASHPWKMRYVQAIGCNEFDKGPKGNFLGGLDNGMPGTFSDCIDSQAAACYRNFFQKSAYGGNPNWYYLDGKPLLIIYDGGWPFNGLLNYWYTFAASSNFPNSYTNYFTVRLADLGDAGAYGWSAYGGVETHDQNGTGTIINPEVELVSPGWISPSWYAATGTYIPRNNGSFYSTYCWERVLANPRPTIVVIADFNDYWEKTAVWTAKSSYDCTIPNLCEPWFGPDGLEHPDMYWNMTIRYIQKLRRLNNFTPILNLLPK